MRLRPLAGSAATRWWTAGRCAPGLLARGRLPGTARPACGPANQAIGVVAAVGLTSCTVPGRCGGLWWAPRRLALAEDGAAGGRGRGSDWWQAADFEQLEPERLELREHAIQRGAVGQRPGQHGVAAAGLGLQGRECGAYRLAQAAADTDAIPVGRPVGVGTGHGLTPHTLNRPAGGSTVTGTGTGDPPAQVDPHREPRRGRPAAGARSCQPPWLICSVALCPLPRACCLTR